MKFEEVLCCYVREDNAEFAAERVRNANDALRYIQQRVGKADRENVYVVNLDTKLKPINFHHVSMGTVNASLFDIANTFKTAIISNASQVIIVHNHPSGDITPSTEDINATRRAVEAGKILGITVCDHIIFGRGIEESYSIRDGYPDIF